MDNAKTRRGLTHINEFLIRSKNSAYSLQCAGFWRVINVLLQFLSKTSINCDEADVTHKIVRKGLGVE